MFWTKPSTDEATPTDPLGLDSMRDELADKLEPCLTGRTRSHEDFYLVPHLSAPGDVSLARCSGRNFNPSAWPISQSAGPIRILPPDPYLISALND
jgi:hypothetical protein